MHIELATWLIRIGIGATMITFGIDQLRDPMKWVREYMPEWLLKILPTKPETDMKLHAVGNIVFGLLLIFTFGLTLTSAWIALIWWITIVPFAFRYKWDIGMRDLSIVFTLIALLYLLY